ncbi:hypothetical protein BC828DRAFT_408211 [Blastocladiella britannica]|nr:hypothetical protein BC828DRAFT_408211 [Blastocladiella britannica]
MHLPKAGCYITAAAAVTTRPFPRWRLGGGGFEVARYAPTVTSISSPRSLASELGQRIRRRRHRLVNRRGLHDARLEPAPEVEVHPCLSQRETMAAQTLDLATEAAGVRHHRLVLALTLGVPVFISHALSYLPAESMMFVLDLAVARARAAPTFLRLHDDIWIWGLERCRRAPHLGHLRDKHSVVVARKKQEASALDGAAVDGDKDEDERASASEDHTPDIRQVGGTAARAVPASTGHLVRTTA